MKSNILQEKADALKAELGAIELKVCTEGYTLAQAMRDGCKVTGKAKNWNVGPNACANGAAVIGAIAAGVIKSE